MRIRKKILAIILINVVSLSKMHQKRPKIFRITLIGNNHSMFFMNIVSKLCNILYPENLKKRQIAVTPLYISKQNTGCLTTYLKFG